MIYFVTALFATLLAILFLERLVQPVTSRPLFHKVSLLAAMPVVIFYLSLFMLSYRLFYSASITLVTYLVIIIVNNAKYRILKEPLVYSDFALLKQAVAHPRLYIDFIGPVKLIGAVSLGTIICTSILVFEPPLINRSSFNDFAPTLVYFFVVFGLIYAITQGPLRQEFRALLKRFGPSTNVEDDIDKLSLVVCLILYFFLAREDDLENVNEDGAEEKVGAMLPGRSSGSLPHIVVVQNESFFDARKVLEHCPDGFLSGFQDACDNSLFYGHLQVPAWGANTLRTEYAFLSGIPAEALGVHRFNPFLKAGRKPQWTLANQLRARGYRTICIHPYHASFFGRDKVYPNLGFDEFIDVSAFSEEDKCGPYISDGAVARKIEQLVEETKEPVFIFVITMENHGQWEVDRIPVKEELLAVSPGGSASFACYLQHLSHADDMADHLKTALKAGGRTGLLCFYGDHQPSFPAIFDNLSHKDERTDYFIWRTDHASNPDANGAARSDISVDALSRLILHSALLEVEENNPENPEG